MNIDCPKIVTLLLIINQRITTLPAIINKKKCYKVMGSQYLLEKNDMPETITVKFEHCSEIRIPFGNA